MKSEWFDKTRGPLRSLPTQGAWIEITKQDDFDNNGLASLPTQGAWIEITIFLNADCLNWSLPTQGAWIEMSLTSPPRDVVIVSLPTQGAWIEIVWGNPDVGQYIVAPYTGSVD